MKNITGISNDLQEKSHIISMRGNKLSDLSKVKYIYRGKFNEKHK